METLGYGNVYKKKYKRKKPNPHGSGVTRILYIPRAVDEHMKLEHKDLIEFIELNGKIIIRKVS